MESFSKMFSEIRQNDSKAKEKETKKTKKQKKTKKKQKKRKMLLPGFELLTI